MFGGIGGALKGLSTKAEEMIEKTKTSVGEMAAEKKAAAAAMIEAQASKTKDALFQTKTNVEGEIIEGANDAKAAAIEGFDKELATAEQTVHEGVQEIEKKADAAPPASGGSGFDPAALASSALAGGLGNIDKEAEKVVDGALQQVSQTVDTKLKEADQFVDHKREEVIKTVQDESQKATSGVSEQLGSVLGKAKGLLNF
uniref:Glucocorticoid-induced transcript 1 protein n=1 Tax=Lygus hesperus TaxID=30085 RepID=A0A0A9Z8P2_LYGHE